MGKHSADGATDDPQFEQNAQMKAHKSDTEFDTSEYRNQPESEPIEDGERGGQDTVESDGVGKVYGNADWAPIDGPMSERAQENMVTTEEVTETYALHETDDGGRYLTDSGADGVEQTTETNGPAGARDI